MSCSALKMTAYITGSRVAAVNQRTVKCMSVAEPNDPMTELFTENESLPAYLPILFLVCVFAGLSTKMTFSGIINQYFAGSPNLQFRLDCSSPTTWYIIAASNFSATFDSTIDPNTLLHIVLKLA
jgi:hypothetical protein